MVSIYKASNSGMAALMRSSGIQAMVDSEAEAAAEHARTIAPVRTGAYRDSIRVEQLPGWDGRAGAAVVADVDYAAAVESEQHPLSQVADYAEGGLW